MPLPSLSLTGTPTTATLFPLSQVRLLASPSGGPFSERQAVHARYLLMVEPDRLLAPFREQAGLTPKATNYGGWEALDIRGHSLGHYLSALALLYGSTGDDAVRERLDYVVSELDACQQANGDGYVLPVAKQAFEQLRAGVIQASGFNLNGVWVPFYTLHKLFAGLRDAYRYAGSALALTIERRLADWLDGVLSPLDAEQIQQMLTCEHGGMNEVLADLTTDTDDPRYLEMAARDFHHTVVLAPMLQGEDKLNGLHGNTQIPKVVGLAREFELTGEPSYRLAAESFWDNVVNRRSFANGGHSESEHFFPVETFPKRLTPFTCETCNTYNLLKLTRHVFAWEPKAAQMDFVERALINHVLTNIGREPGEFGYFLGLGSVGVKVFSTQYDSWWCCVGTGLESPARYGEQIYAHSADTLWVNLFIGSTLDWQEKGIRLRQETRFPDADTVRLAFDCDAPTAFALRLRHPYWCERPEIRLNGELNAVDSLPSSYITIERTWQSGDTLEIRLPMALRLEPLPYSDDKIVAVMFGPLVLAGVVPEEEGIPRDTAQRFGDHLRARGKTDAFPPLFVAAGPDAVLAHLQPTGDAFAEFRSQGVIQPRDIDFVPFHRIYEEQYAVYLPLLTADEWAERETQIRAERERQVRQEAATIDSVTPGYQQPEVEHLLREENSATGDFQDRKFRETHHGWFSYEMTVDPAAPMALVATYWGAEWGGCHFDILLDGETIATQHLHADKPGDFFSVTYPLPPEKTRGKTRVTVRFQPAHAGVRVGRLFGLQMMRSDASTL